jgi:hypothetical protein
MFGLDGDYKAFNGLEALLPEARAPWNSGGPMDIHVSFQNPRLQYKAQIYLA